MSDGNALASQEVQGHQRRRGRKVDKKNGARLEYWGCAINGGRQVKIVAIAQCVRKTVDSRCDAGGGEEIGVITAYCKGTNKCLNWISP